MLLTHSFVPLLPLLQLFPPLLVGASLVVAESRGHLDPSYIIGLVIQHQVTEFIFSVPTMVMFFCSLCVHSFDSPSILGIYNLTDSFFLLVFLSRRASM